MKAKKVFFVFLVIAAVLLLSGCYCCPTYPQEQFKPQILGEIGYCPTELPDDEPLSDILEQGMLKYMRDISPWAGDRWGAKENYQLTSLADSQKVIDNIGNTVDLIDSFHSQPGCSELPFGYVEYSDGSQDYITAVLGSSEIEFYKVLGPSGNLVKMYPDYSITEIVLY